MGAKSTFKSALLTGLIALLPLGILVIVVLWIYSLIEGIVAPILTWIGIGAQFYIVLIALIALVLFIVLIGLAIRTRPGRALFAWFEEGILHALPGYKNIKKLIGHFTGKEANKMYRSVGLVDIFQNGTYMTCFIVEKSSKNTTTVFVPTGPNPTSGLIYHVQDRFVHRVNLSIEKALESVISVGRGSSLIFKELEKQSAKDRIAKRTSPPKKRTPKKTSRKKKK